MKEFTAFVLLTLEILEILTLIECRATPGTNDKTDLCGPRDWHHMGMNKCLKLMDGGKKKTFDEAKALCEKENPLSTLPSVETREQQNFLQILIGPNAVPTDNIWLGMEIINETRVWSDGLALNYSNFDPANSPRRPSTRKCLQIGTHRAPQSQWAFTDCGTRNLVICQKPQTWSPSKIKDELLKMREAMTSMGNLEDIKSFLQQFQALKTDLADVRHSLEGIETKVIGSIEKVRNVEDAIMDAKKDIMDLKSLNSSRAALPTGSPSSSTASSSSSSSSSTAIPVGFVYIQYGSQQAPSQLWPSFTWVEITSNYAGMFFRAVGGGAAAFGVRQEFNAPRVTSVGYKDLEEHPHEVTLVPGSTTSAVRTGHWDSNLDKVGLTFTTSPGEVRPVNSAVKIWKRTA